MINIICTDNNPTIRYAADELRAYLSRLAGQPATCDPTQPAIVDLGIVTPIRA